MNAEKKPKVFISYSWAIQGWVIELAFKKIEAMKPLRDLYLDFLKEIILSERNIYDFVCDFFEKVYNELEDRQIWNWGIELTRITTIHGSVSFP
ncbi:hypothetical protein [Fibrobacter sp.]